jgi:membrane protease YdiL (CAAX protease family)
MRTILPYLLIWVLLASVRPARVVLAWQFGRLPAAMRRTFWLGLVAGVSLVALNGMLLLWNGAVSAAASYSVSGVAILAAVAFAALVATTEEMLLRGLLLTRLREISTTPVAVIVTSVLFALMHLGRADFSLYTTAQYLADGLLLAWMVLVTGDIWMAMGFHFAKDLGVYILFGGSRHILPPLLTSPPPAVWADLVSYAVTVACVTWLLGSARDLSLRS